MFVAESEGVSAPFVAGATSPVDESMAEGSSPSESVSCVEQAGRAKKRRAVIGAARSKKRCLIILRGVSGWGVGVEGFTSSPSKGHEFLSMLRTEFPDLKWLDSQEIVSVK